MTSHRCTDCGTTESGTWFALTFDARGRSLPLGVARLVCLACNVKRRQAAAGVSIQFQSTEGQQ